MKKKLFLIPITLISCLLSSCNSSKHIKLEEYFIIQQDYSHVIIGEEDQYDYDHVVGNILAKYALCLLSNNPLLLSSIAKGIPHS